ncbi:MAG: DUF58 domain-containing protein, partial [Candidatus Tectomicrobia bacterium]|nr:DUF58 domain-containing protein [Candidatus Tectomicrobia bacterium]
MQRRNAALNYYYFILLLLGVVLSTVSRRLEPVWVILPLAIALLYSRLTQTTPAFTVRCQVAPHRAFEGDLLTVTISLKATTAVPPLELWHPLPPEATCIEGSNRHLLTLRPGEERTVQHTLTIAQRGQYTLGRLYGRVHPATDLQPILLEVPDEQVCSIYPRIAPLPRHLPPLHTYASFGHYVSRHAGEGLEFAGIRPYNQGDRLRRVHWRTSLQRQQLYVTDYYCERNADVVLLLDTLVSIGTERVNTLDVAVRAAASLAAHYLYYKDRVGLVNYGGVCTWVPPAVGQLQLYRLLDALLETRTHFSYLSKDITLIPPRVLPPGALIFVLTTFLDPRLETALHDLLARAFQLVLVVLSPVRVMPGKRHPRQIEATARLWHLEMEARMQPFRRAGVPVLLQTSD